MTKRVTTFLNYIFRDYDSQKYNDSITKKFSGSEQAKVRRMYEESLGETKANSTAHLNQYLKSRTESLPTGITCAEIPALSTLKTSLPALDQEITKTGARILPDDLNHKLTDAKKSALEAIKEQHDADVAAIKAVSVPSPQMADEGAREQILKALNTAHVKAETEFSKKMKEEITTIHRAAYKERERISILGTLRNSTEMNRSILNSVSRWATLKPSYTSNNKDRIDQLHQNKKDPASATITTVGTEGFLAGLSIEEFLQFNKDLAQLTTLTGLAITANKIEPNGYSFSITLPSALLSSYHADAANLAKVDFLFIAQLAHATNSEEITGFVNIKHNEKLAIALAMQLYASYLEAGFHEAQIKGIEVNGKLLSKDELFKDHPGKLQAVEAKAAQANKDSGVEYTRDPETMKEKLKKQKEQHRAATPPEQNQAAAPHQSHNRP
jgi:hypothetical protein